MSEGVARSRQPEEGVGETAHPEMLVRAVQLTPDYIAEVAEEIREEARYALETESWLRPYLPHAPKGLGDGVGFQCGTAVIGVSRGAVPGELVGIYDHFLDGPAARLVFREAIKRLLEPSIVGVGEVRVVPTERADGVKVVLANPRREDR